MHLKLYIIVCLLLVGLSSCSLFSRKAAKRSVEQIRVSNAEELQNALGSNRTVILDTGLYLFDQGIRMDNIINLSIIGEDREHTRIVVKDSYDDIITLDSTQQITISNLTLDHEPQGNCLGGVILVTESRDIDLHHLNLFGSGIEGLTLYHVDGLKLMDSRIWDCSVYSMTITDSKNITIGRTVIENDQVYKNIHILGSDVLMDSVVADVKAFYPPFIKVDSEPPYHLQYKGIKIKPTVPSQVKLRNCKFKGRYSQGRDEKGQPLSDDPNKLLTNYIERVTIENCVIDIDGGE